jgi:argininosuccinate lyase
MWGGRFSLPPAEALWDFTVDHADRRLIEFDILGSIAHVAMLTKVGLLTGDEKAAIDAGLGQIVVEATSGTFGYLDSDEDVHSAVERRLVELVGEVGEKLHTGRSRNDQMALDLRLFLRKAATDRIEDLERFALVLADLAEANAEVVVPTYTHLQQAQVASLGHHFLAYAWMALRDRDRLVDLGKRLDVSPLGAGASAGSSLPIDPSFTATQLGLDQVFSNSLDAVSSRDLVSEFVFCAAQAMVNVSRLSEEMVRWASTEFGWVTYADSFTTGSSALPHKKNPDIAELARGKSAGVIGDLTSLLVLQKGLPLSYNRDLQEDKPPLFRADDALAATLRALSGMLTTADFHPPTPSSFTTALDLAEALVRRGVPFRQAHKSVGVLVASLIESGRTLDQATAADLNNADPLFEELDLKLIDPIASASRRATPGSGSPRSVREQVAAIRKVVPGHQPPVSSENP